MSARGVVSDDLEATFPLVVPMANGDAETVTAVIDTGFNGYLTLTSGLLRRAGFRFHSYAQTELADGTSVALHKFEGEVLWQGLRRPVTALATESSPLIGMALLAGDRLVVDVAAGGKVLVEPIPATAG